MDLSPPLSRCFPLLTRYGALLSAGAWSGVQKAPSVRAGGLAGDVAGVVGGADLDAERTELGHVAPRWLSCSCFGSHSPPFWFVLGWCSGALDGAVRWRSVTAVRCRCARGVEPAPSGEEVLRDEVLIGAARLHVGALRVAFSQVGHAWCSGVILTSAGGLSSYATLIVLLPGSWRIRLPVIAAIALVSAGAADGTLTSPTPVGGSVDSIRWTSIVGVDRLGIAEDAATWLVR